MNNFKFASKLRIFAIISFAIIVLGMALGTVFHFIGGGFFGYGGEYSGYKSVTVSYVYAEFGEAADVKEICEAEFGKAGIKSFVSTEADNGTSNEITYKFSQKTDDGKLKGAVEGINASLQAAAAEDTVSQSRASFGTECAILGGGQALSRAAIAVAVIIAVQVLYSLIRYKLSAMCAALIIQLHNAGLFAAVLALCRIPVTSSVMTFAVIGSLVTALCLTVLFENIKRARKDADNAKLSAGELCDLCARRTFKTNLVFCAFLAVAAILVFVFTAISSLSLTVILSASLCALVAFAVSFYGSVIFAPAVYALFGKLSGKTAEPSQKKG